MSITATDDLKDIEQFKLNPRRGKYIRITDREQTLKAHWTEPEREIWDRINLVYRTLCGILYNFVPTSGHPGGSISSGHMVQGLIYRTMDYDFTDPDRLDADMISYAAGHKAMGLYAMWALRNELVRIGNPRLLAPEKRQLRWEDLLGFRRNPTNETPLFKSLRARALDGHPTCATPFIRVATGASGVGVPASLGLAHAALDYYGDAAPRMHFIEGEGGMTPGRVHEAMAAAATAQIYNAVMHVDWNQASIDSNQVCREGGSPGEYVQWNPAEIAYVHDWNVILVPDATDFQQTLAAQRLACTMDNHQPTAIVYRTVKGWRYGIEGSPSHGAGHKFDSEGYYKMLAECEDAFGMKFPHFDGKPTPDNIEQNYWTTLLELRKLLERSPELTGFAATAIAESRERLGKAARKPRADGPKLDLFYRTGEFDPTRVPEKLQAKPGDAVTTRGMLGDALNVINKRTQGAIFAAAADLAGSTNIGNAAKGFGTGFYNAALNPQSRLIPVGGICEDAMGAWMAGLSSFGQHIGATASYGAFIAALEHVAARLHGIGQQTFEAVTGTPYKTWIMVNAHAGVKTGEDGPTHADPQALQLLQECFPGKVMITLTPWDALEIWPLLIAGLKARPAILAPVVTRPADIVVDRVALKLPPAEAAIKGVYAMRRADLDAEAYHGTVVLQGNGVGTIFVNDVLPALDQDGWNLNVYYIASAELFNLLSLEEQEEIFPQRLAMEAVGITDFTLPTMYRWVRSNEGIRRTLHSFRGNHYLGSGAAPKVLEEAGIHAAGQIAMIRSYAQFTENLIKRRGRL
jgi:transketolase